MKHRKHPLSVVSLFSGIGGFDLAFQREGFSTYAHSETDKFACRIYHRHFPESICLGDITLLDTFVKIPYIRKNGDGMKLKKLAQWQVDESIRLYQQGFSLGIIASYWGVSRQAMWDLLRRRIELRPQKRTGKEIISTVGEVTQTIMLRIWSSMLCKRDCSQEKIYVNPAETKTNPSKTENIQFKPIIAITTDL